MGGHDWNAEGYLGTGLVIDLIHDMQIDLSILIVNYNTQALLAQCLDSIEKYLANQLAFEVIVVDNASSDGSAKWAEAERDRKPWLKVIASSQNLGFASGNNLGIPSCHGQFLLLLNSDALLVDDSVKLGIEFLQTHPKYFAVAAHLLNGDGSSGPSYGHFPSPVTLWRELTLSGFGRLRAVSPPSNQAAIDVDFPCGAYFLIRRELLNVIGVMNGDYFLYFEETDWARRAYDLGYRIRYLPECKAIHLGGGSSEGRKPIAISALFYESWHKYITDHHGLVGVGFWWVLIKSYLLAGVVLNLARLRFQTAKYFIGQLMALTWGVLGKPSSKFRAR